MERRTSRTIRVDYIARVEGESALDLQIRDGRVTSARLKIFEPPRLFEALLRGRGFAEAPDITARICGICPVAYQMSVGACDGGCARRARRTGSCARCAGCCIAASGSRATRCTW